MVILVEHNGLIFRSVFGDIELWIQIKYFNIYFNFKVSGDTYLMGIVDAGGLVTSLALITNLFCGPSVPSLTVTPWINGWA